MIYSEFLIPTGMPGKLGDEKYKKINLPYRIRKFYGWRYKAGRRTKAWMPVPSLVVPEEFVHNAEDWDGWWDDLEEHAKVICNSNKV